ncbi:MAG: lysylphosphatidylglycerol synthase transmembrane domain-containing protein [Methanobacteriota archaeon]
MKVNAIPGWIKTIIKLIIGVGIIVFLSLKFNPSDIIKAIANVQIPLLILAVAVYSGTLLLLSLRWRFILKKMGHHIPIMVTYQAFIAGILISDLTPARIGELSRPLTIRDQVPVPVGISSVFLDRYCDFIAIFILGCGGIFLFSAARSLYMILVMVIILSIPIGLLSAFWFKRTWALKMLHIFKVGKINEFADHLGSAMDSLNEPKKTMGIAIFFTLIIWIFQSLRVVLISAAAGYIIPIQELVLVQPLISALALIPLSISGLGFVEGGYVTLFAQFGVPVATGLAIALLDRFLTVCFHMVVGIRYALRAVSA